MAFLGKDYNSSLDASAFIMRLLCGSDGPNGAAAGGQKVDSVFTHVTHSSSAAPPEGPVDKAHSCLTLKFAGW
jgi:hypothetical protein